MACSDNVIRAGLTPKQKDLPNLMQNMVFDCSLSSAQKLLPCREDIYTEVFRPPVSEFAVAKITVSFHVFDIGCNYTSSHDIYLKYFRYRLGNHFTN